MRITKEYLFSKRYHILILPEIIAAGDAFTEEQLQSPSDRIKFFEHVERLMLKWSPWRFQMGRVKNFYVQLAPILNKIDAMLEWILTKAEVSKGKETVEEHFNTFMRALNFFHHITRELTIGERKEKEDQEIHTTYLDRLVSFLKYTQEPLYIQRLSTLVARFARKLLRSSDKEEYLIPILNFLNYGWPFLKLISSHSFLVKNVIDRVDKVTRDTLKAVEWREFTTNLQSKISVGNLQTYIEEPHQYIDTRVSAWSEGDETKALRLAGEATLLKILASGRTTTSFEVAAICSSVLLLHGAITLSNKFSSNAKYTQTHEGVAISTGTVGALSFRQFLDKIIKDLRNLKNSPASVSPLEAKLLVQTVGLFTYMSHKSMTILGEKDKYNNEYSYYELIDEMLSEIGGDPNASSDAELSKSRYNDMNELLDHLAFVPPEGDLSTRLSYLDSYSNLGTHHLALEAFGNLQLLGKFMRHENPYKGDKYWFNSLSPIVKKRLEDFELDDYFSSQLPDYCLQVQVICTEADDRSSGQLSTNLSSWASENCVKNLEKVVKEDLLDKLLKESPRKEYAKDQLVNYYMGWHMLWFQSFYDAASSHDYFLQMNSGYLNKDKINQTMKQEYLVKVFNIEEPEALDPQKKELIGFLFFLGVTYFMDLQIDEQPGDSEENLTTIIKLISFYFNPKMLDFMFLYRMHDYLRNYSSYSLAKALLESTFVKRTQFLDIWFSDTIFECESGPAMTTGSRRWPSQYVHSWYVMPIISPYFGIEPFFAQNYYEDEDKYDEAITPVVITKFLEITKMMKERIEKFNDLTIGVLHGKVDPLSLGVFQRRLETQLGMYPDLFEAINNYLSSDEKTKLGHEAFKIFTRDLGVLAGKERFDSRLQDKHGLKPTLFNAAGYFEILDLIESLGEKGLSIYTNPKIASSLSKKELDDFARLNYYFMTFNRTYERNYKNPYTHQMELTKIYTSEKFNPEKLIDAFYRLISLAVPTEDNLSFVFPEFTLMPTNSPRKRHMDDSFLGYLLFAFERDEENSNQEIINKVFEALNSRLDFALNEFKSLSTSSNEAQINYALTSFSHWIALTKVLPNYLGEREPLSQSVYKGWSDFVCNKNLVNKLPKIISTLEEKFRTLGFQLSNDLYKKKFDILYSVIELGLTIQSKVFSRYSSEVVLDINAKASLTLEEKKNIITNLATALTEMFLNLDISNPITLPERKSQIPFDYYLKVFSLLITEDIPEEPEEEQQHQEEGRENQEEGAQQPEESPSLSQEDVNMLYFASWKKFISANYKQFIPRLLLSFPMVSPLSNFTFEKVVKAVFASGIAKEKQLQEYMKGLHTEAERVLEAFAKEDIDILAELKSEVLPKVNTSLKPGFDTLFSAILYYGFHEKVIAVVPKVNREFVPPILCENIFFEFSQEINIKFSKLLDDKLRELYLKDIEGVFPGVLAAFDLKPVENRLKKHADLYETPANEFQAAQLKDIELIYQEAKITLLNQSLVKARVKKLECTNLLLAMIWNKDYAEKAVNDGIFEHIFNLEGDVNTTILPFIVELVIGSQIPLENRIEIALKAALLRAGSVKVLLGDDTILALKPYLFENPNLFKKIYQDLFTVKELSNGEVKSTSDFTVTLKSGHDWTSLGQSGQNIVDYLNNSLSQLSKTIVKQLAASIVARNEKIWRNTIFKDQRNFDDFKSDEKIFEDFESLKQSHILMSLILRKYPELRAYASELKVSTHIFDTATLNFQELSEPQELTFLDYALHIIQPPTYPVNSGLVTSFFERGTPAFTLKQGDEVITSHEYYARLTIEKCLNALRVLTSKELETFKRSQICHAYAQTIRNALRTDWKASNYASRTSLETIAQLEEIITDNLLKGRTITELFLLIDVLRVQVHDQIVNAYAQLNPSNVQENFFSKFKEFNEDEYQCIRSILHFDRDYSKLDDYTNKIELHFKDVQLASKIDDSKSSPLLVTNIEDPNRKALLVRAILEGKNVDNKLAFSAGCHWDAYLRNNCNTPPKNQSPGSDPFCRLFEMFVEKTDAMKSYVTTEKNVYANSGLEDTTSRWGLKFTREVKDKFPKPLNFLDEVVKKAHPELKGVKNSKKQKPLNGDLVRQLDKLVVQKLFSEEKPEQEDDNDEYAPFRLFSGQEAEDISKLRNKIEAKIHSIIGNIQETKFIEVDPELNKYIFNLETELEQTVALLSLDDMYAGMLNPVYREFREDCLLRLRARSDEGAKWRQIYREDDADSNDSNEGTGQQNESEEIPADQPAENEEPKETTEIEVIGTEDQYGFYGYIYEGDYTFYVGRGFDAAFFPGRSILFDSDSEKQQVFKTYINFYLEHQGKAGVARRNLYHASNRFLEHWVISYILNPPKDQPAKECFVALFTNLAANPLNEIRILDIILTLYSMDPSSQALLKEFNSYFNANLTKDEFKSKITIFSEDLMNILEEYIQNSVNKKNALELENFDEVVAATEKIVGVLPFKNKVKIYASADATKNAWAGICKKILELEITNSSILKKAINIIAKFELRDLTPYDRTPQQTSASIQSAINCIIGLPKHSRMKKNLFNKIIFCLENKEVFSNFLNILQKEYAASIESANVMLSEWVSQLKRISQGELDKSELETLLKAIHEDKDIQKNQLFIQLIVKQSENIAGSLKQAGDKFSDEQRTLCSSVKRVLGGLLDSKGFKNMYLYSIQIFELIEAIKRGSAEAIGNLSHLETLLDLIIDMYRVYRVHRILQEIGERMMGILGKQLGDIQIPAQSNDHIEEEEKMPSESTFGGVQTKGEIEGSITSIRESGIAKYDEMLMRLSQKARTLLQGIKLSPLPCSVYVLEIVVKREEERFTHFPWLLSFDKKLEIFKTLWDKERYKLDSYTMSFDVQKTCVIEDSKRQLEVFIDEHPSSRIANTEFRVGFSGEDGYDTSALRNEWLSLVCKKLFDPAFGLFKKSENEMGIQPDPKSCNIPEYLSYFHFAGCIIGYAVLNKLTVPVNFARSFLKLITDREVAIPVAETDQQLMNSIEGPVNAFKQGSHRFVDPGYLKIFSVAELDKLIAGDPAIDFDDFKANTHYEGGYTIESEQIVWFWEIVKDYDQENLSALLFFGTGLPRAVPEGFKNRYLTIQKTSDPVTSLPKSHACFAKIDLPEYRTKEELAEKLLLAICEGEESFRFA